MLTSAEKKRYSRHLLLKEVGLEGQQKLKSARVLVIGAGGLGCPMLQYIAAAGVGVIGISDGDQVDESNLQRQVLYNLEDVGKNKADVIVLKLQLQNPFVKFISYTSFLTATTAMDIISHYDIVVDGSDNFATRYLVNDACVMLNKPFVSGSIFKYAGQVSVFNFRNGPTYRCLYPEPPTDSPTCSEIGVLNVLPGIMGSIMASEVLKIIIGIGEPLSGKLLVIDALTLQNQLLNFEKCFDTTKITALANYENSCSDEPKAFNEISSLELKNRMDKKEDIQIIDVRDPSEFLESNINGINIPLDILAENIDKIRKDIPVVIHCKSGGRSKRAIELLKNKFGYLNLINLSGGLDAFIKLREL